MSNKYSVTSTNHADIKRDRDEALLECNIKLNIHKRAQYKAEAVDTQKSFTQQFVPVIASHTKQFASANQQRDDISTPNSIQHIVPTNQPRVQQSDNSTTQQFPLANPLADDDQRGDDISSPSQSQDITIQNSNENELFSSKCDIYKLVLSNVRDREIELLSSEKETDLKVLHNEGIYELKSDWVFSEVVHCENDIIDFKGTDMIWNSYIFRFDNEQVDEFQKKMKTILKPKRPYDKKLVKFECVCHVEIEKGDENSRNRKRTEIGVCKVVVLAVHSSTLHLHRLLVMSNYTLIHADFTFASVKKVSKNCFNVISNRDDENVKLTFPDEQAQLFLQRLNQNGEKQKKVRGAVSFSKIKKIDGERITDEFEDQMNKEKLREQPQENPKAKDSRKIEETLRDANLRWQQIEESKERDARARERRQKIIEDATPLLFLHRCTIFQYTAVEKIANEVGVAKLEYNGPYIGKSLVERGTTLRVVEIENAVWIESKLEKFSAQLTCSDFIYLNDKSLVWGMFIFEFEMAEYAQSFVNILHQLKAPKNIYGDNTLIKRNTCLAIDITWHQETYVPLLCLIAILKTPRDEHVLTVMRLKDNAVVINLPLKQITSCENCVMESITGSKQIKEAFKVTWKDRHTAMAYYFDLMKGEGEAFFATLLELKRNDDSRGAVVEQYKEIARLRCLLTSISKYVVAKVVKDAQGSHRLIVESADNSELINILFDAQLAVINNDIAGKITVTQGKQIFSFLVDSNVERNSFYKILRDIVNELKK